MLHLHRQRARALRYSNRSQVGISRKIPNTVENKKRSNKAAKASFKYCSKQNKCTSWYPGRKKKTTTTRYANTYIHCLAAGHIRAKIKACRLLLLRRIRWRCERCVCARDRDRGVGLLAWCGIYMLVVSFLEAWGRQGWRRSTHTRWCIEAILTDLGGRTCDLDRRRTERERLWLNNLADLRVLYFVTLTCLGGRVRVNVHWVAWRWAPATGAGG
jgi:hypothetical protein